MAKILVDFDLCTCGELGLDTEYKGLRVGDVINVEGDDCIVVKLYSFFSVMGYVPTPLDELSQAKKTDYKKVYGYEEITEDNVEAISGFKFYIKELDGDGNVPITIEEAERFICRKVKIVS